MDKLLPKKTPWSRIVGGGFILSEPNGAAKYKIMIIGISDGMDKERDAEICERLMSGWNARANPMPSGETDQILNDMFLLLCRFIYRTRNHTEFEKLRESAKDYLERLGLHGNILRSNRLKQGETKQCSASMDQADEALWAEGENNG